MADYTTQLKNLKEAEKKAAITDLENTRNQTLSNLEAEQSKLGSTYDAKRTQTSNASKVNARNFQEYLANTGRANSGIGAQYEMGRQNSLNRDLNALNVSQAQDMADIERRRTLANDAYNTGLAGANAQVEANYIQNLLKQQQQQWENNMALKQFNEQVRQFNLSRKGFSSGGYSSSGGSSGKKGNGNDNIKWNEQQPEGGAKVSRQRAQSLVNNLKKLANKKVGIGGLGLPMSKTPLYLKQVKAQLGQFKSDNLISNEDVAWALKQLGLQ